ncbi:hypothetical protein PIB30_058490 [Stylosanthes scabra]|uniref:Uncharacterized protein n=1 Tax=Stylosanthes scabra TaxID=79078 RepID=A0ABU6SK03_9FABA|nr:hypothetical protein [Stylosanthes scabra]
MSWIYHRFPGMCPPIAAHDTWSLAERLIGLEQGSRDVQEARLLQWRSRLDRVTHA